MAKVTVNTEKDTDKQAIENSQVDGARIVDAKGRVLILRELGILEESRVIKAVGTPSNQDMVYMNGYVIPAVVVASIDGDDCVVPRTQIEVDAAIQRVGSDGIRAVLGHMDAKAKPASGDSLKN